MSIRNIVKMFYRGEKVVENTLRKNRMANKTTKSIILFLPALLFIGGLFLAPMILTVYYSVTNISLTGSAAQAMQFVGFKNFLDAFSDPNFGTIMLNTFIFLLFSGIIGQQCFGFFLAYLMKKRSKAIRRFVGFMVVVGWVTPEIVAAYMFTAYFADKGTLNNILGLFGLSPISWLFTFPMVCIIVANIWKGSAYSMMMFQAALDGVPDDIVEAAKIDGANFFQILTRITIPMIKGTIGTTFVLVTLGTLGTFGLVYALTGGGPGIQTTTLAIYMYQQAFSAYQIGYGMAIALAVLVLGTILSLIYMKIIKSDE